MGIEAAKVENWAGEASRVVKPIDCADCPNSPGFNALCLAESVSGRGCTIRGGVGHAKRTVAEIVATCFSGLPAISSVTPDPLKYLEGMYVNGTGFGFGQGQLWLMDSMYHCRAENTFELTVIWQWTPILIHASMEFPGPPWSEHYVHVRTAVGKWVAEGYEVDITWV